MQKYMKLRYRLPIGAEWLFLRKGPGATNHFEGGGFARSNEDVAYPNLMFHFLPIAVRYDGSAPASGDGYQVHIGPMYSDARGSVKITSRNPRVKPALRFNYLSTDQDRREWVEAIRVARNILNQPAMAPYNGGETSPGPSVSTDEEILEWVRNDGETALHPSCTAKMGTDDMAVVDPLTMNVHGLRRAFGRRRLVDALRHQRQHLRAGDDAGREVRRHHPGQHPARRRARSSSTATSAREVTTRRTPGRFGDDAGQRKTTVRVPFSRTRRSACQRTARARTCASTSRPASTSSSGSSWWSTRATSCSMIGPSSRSSVT